MPADRNSGEANQKSKFCRSRGENLIMSRLTLLRWLIFRLGFLIASSTAIKFHMGNPEPLITVLQNFITI